MALSQALNLDIKIAYLDGHSDKVDFLDLKHGKDTGTQPITLLYRSVLPDVSDRDS